MLVSGIKERRMDKVRRLGLMVLTTRVALRMISKKDMENILLRMAIFMRGHGFKERSLGTEHLFFRMIRSMKGIFLRELERAMVHFTGLMAKYIKDNGKTENLMV